MKTAVVFYSLEGNTRMAAEQIAAKLDADLISLTPVKEYPKTGLAKFFHGGKAATFGEKPELKPYTFSGYDRVILGCPVWAGKCAPPVNTFLSRQKDALKAMGSENIGILLCQSGNGADKVLANYKKELGIDSFRAELVLIDPKRRPNSGNDEKIAQFCEAFRD